VWKLVNDKILFIFCNFLCTLQSHFRLFSDAVMSPNEERSTSNTPKRKLPSSLDSQSTKRSRLAGTVLGVMVVYCK